MAGNSKKIVIKGGYGYTNFGDDALIKVIYDEFIIDKTNVTFSCILNSYLSKLAPEASFIPVKNCYDDYDYLIYGGGTQFYSFKPKRSFFKRIIHAIRNFDIVLKRIKEKFVRKVVCDYRNTKLGALGVGVGPFLPNANPIIEVNTSQLFNKIDFLAVRDLHSHNKCNEWGAKHHYLTDICYGSVHSKFNNKITVEKVKNIAVIVRDWNETIDGSQYQNSLIENVKYFRKNGFNITYIVFAKQKDMRWISELKKINEKYILWNPDQDSVDGFIDKLSDFDLFITARYHGAVYSTLLRKPFIAIEVEQKLGLIHDVYKKGSYVWSFPFKKEKLINYVHDINDNYSSFKNEVDKVTILNVVKAEIMKVEFKNFIKN